MNQRSVRRLMARLAVVVAVAAACLAPGAASPAAPASASINRWNEYEFYKVGSTLYATAFRDCVPRLRSKVIDC